MDALVTVAVLAGVGALTSVAARVGYRLWRAVMLEERPVLMHRVLERQGLSVADNTEPMEPARRANAIRRCVACRERESCLAWLEGDESIAFERFCPNAALISGLKAGARAAARTGG
jgi:hypothetical protein